MEKQKYVLLDEKGKPVSVIEVPIYKPEELLLHLRTLKPILYNVLLIDLGIARTGQVNEEFLVAGDFLGVLATTGVSEVIFNEPTYPNLELIDRLTIATPFYRFFIVNAAQVGEILTLVVGKESLFKMGWLP